MKTLVVYASRHGCAEKCAHLLVDNLSGEVDVVNLAKTKVPDLAVYDTVIIGGSIHMGKIQKSVTVFCQNEMKELLEKKVGLYLCCANLDVVEMQMKGAFPEPLYSHATAREHFGYTYDFSKMNFLERAAIKHVAKTDKSVEYYLMDNLERFVAAVG